MSGTGKYEALNGIVKEVHQKNCEAGWWEDLAIIQSQLPNKRHQDMVESWFLATKIALIHSEVSEMFEGMRKGEMDDHLKDLPAEHVEGADVFLRLADYMGRRRVRLGDVAEDKEQYNRLRLDHQRDTIKKGGTGVKKF